MLQLDTPARKDRAVARTERFAGTAATASAATAPGATAAVDIVDQWGVHSFPASDPPANW